MADIPKDVAITIRNALRSGTVPDHGLHHYAVGLEPQMKEMRAQLDYVASGKSELKFIRGEYGAGKTFLTSLVAAEALQRNFVTTKVVISNVDTPLYRLGEVYRKACAGLSLTGRTGCFSAVLDQWLLGLEQQVIDIDGLDEDSPDFHQAVDRKVDQFLKRVGEKAGRFASAVKAYHKLQFEEDYQASQGMLDWMSGDPHVATSIKKLAHVKGDLAAGDVFGFLAALLEVIRQSKYSGLVLVLDEVETTIRERKPERKKSLEVLRQLVDAIRKNEFPGLYLLVTGTADFFDAPDGVPSLEPLHQRIRVDFSDNKPDNLRQPQIRLPAFDRERLKLVAHRVREIYPADNTERVRAKVDNVFVEKLVAHFTTGFGGVVSVTPRLFLREFIDVMDRVDIHDDYDPADDYEFEPDKLRNDGLEPEEEEFLGREVVL